MWLGVAEARARSLSVELHNTDVSPETPESSYNIMRAREGGLAGGVSTSGSIEATESYGLCMFTAARCHATAGRGEEG